MTIKTLIIPIGEGFELEIKENGFTLWDRRKGDNRWVLDASTFAEEGQITIDVNKFAQRVDKWNKKRTLTLRKKK